MRNTERKTTAIYYDGYGNMIEAQTQKANLNKTGDGIRRKIKSTRVKHLLREYYC